MKVTYRINMYDNGWTLGDNTSCVEQVIQEKPSDKQHRKMKGVLGEWLYDDIDRFLKEIDDIECEIELNFRKVKKGGDELKEIPKDKDGLFIDDGTMYNELPIYVINEDDGTQELVDKDNWIDWLSDFNKERYKFYMKGGDE